MSEHTRVSDYVIVTHTQVTQIGVPLLNRNNVITRIIKNIMKYRNQTRY